MTQKKTGKKVEVPIFDDRVYELCEKYNYNFPDITAQKMNLKIKVVGYELSKTVPRAKYELICSHTARRSGTTNLYKLGVLSDLELRSITGHESQKNFEGYIRIGISEQAQRVGDKIKAAREAMKKQVDK